MERKEGSYVYAFYTDSEHELVLALTNINGMLSHLAVLDIIYYLEKQYGERIVWCSPQLRFANN